MKFSLTAFAVVAMAFLALAPACKKSVDENAPSPGSFDAAIVTAQSKPLRGIGIVECDGYISSYDKCLSEKVPAAERAKLRKRVGIMRASWSLQAKDATKRSHVVESCKRVRDQDKASMQSYGCAL